MSKTVKVNHVVLTLALSSAAQATGGNSRDEIDDMVNKRLAEGYDEVEIHVLRTNFDERQQPTHIVNQYIFKAFEKETVAKTKKADA